MHNRLIPFIFHITTVHHRRGREPNKEARGIWEGCCGTRRAIRCPRETYYGEMPQFRLFRPQCSIHNLWPLSSSSWRRLSGVKRRRKGSCTESTPGRSIDRTPAQSRGRRRGASSQEVSTYWVVGPHLRWCFSFHCINRDESSRMTQVCYLLAWSWATLSTFHEQQNHIVY